jgi:membrane associated rhomboid family serine protease
LDIWILAVILVILASIVYSAWKQTAFSIIASVACVAVIILSIVGQELDSSGIADQLAFMPHDIVDPAREYTLLTSMFMHTGFTHLFVNLLMLVLVGLVFEQRIGTRPFIVLYLLAGIVGTLTFAAVRWNDPALAVVGASGAITGILGAFARLYPNEKMMLFFLPIPMSIWTIVLIFVLIQFLLLFGHSNIAVESHLGGLVAGVLLAPYVVRLPLGQRPSVTVAKPRVLSIDRLRRVAVTPQLKAVLDRIENEEVQEVRNAWIDDFLSKAKCPQCGSRLKAEKENIVCEKGHII